MSHRWKLFIAVAIVMLALTCVWVVTMSLVPSNDVEAYKKSLIAKGEKLKISEVMPAPVRPEQNGADIVREAFGLLNPAGDDYRNLPSSMQMIAPGKAIIGFMQPDIRTLTFTNSWSNVMDAVESSRPVTELLRQAMSYPTIDFHLDYEKGPETLLPHLGQMKRCAQRLTAEAICDLHQGDTASATTNLCAVLGLANRWQDERFLISQIVRIAMAAIAAEANWELLQSTNVNDAELAMLQTNWQKLEYIHPMENAFLMKRASSEYTMKKMRESNEYFNHLMSGFGRSGSGRDFWNNVKFTGAKFMWQVSWTYSDELRMLEDDQIIMETIRTIETNGFFYPAYTNMLNQLDANEPTNDPDSWINKMDQVGLQRLFSEGVSTGTVLGRTMAAEVTRRVVITAIALKRYQLRHGNYPEYLKALVPEFLPAVPLDPVDGKPLRYHPNADGTYILYSVGENGTDDGGNPTTTVGYPGPTFPWLSRSALDWVWPQPATAAEIQYYYAHPPK